MFGWSFPLTPTLTPEGEGVGGDHRGGLPRPGSRWSSWLAGRLALNSEVLRLTRMARPFAPAWSWISLT